MRNNIYFDYLHKHFVVMNENQNWYIKQIFKDIVNIKLN